MVQRLAAVESSVAAVGTSVETSKVDAEIQRRVKCPPKLTCFRHRKVRKRPTDRVGRGRKTAHLSLDSVVMKVECHQHVAVFSLFKKVQAVTKLYLRCEWQF